MRTRRGTTYWPGELGKHISTFQVGDLVISTLIGDGFYGVVRDIHPKINKVMVAWGGGAVVQHDPEEVQLSPHQEDIVKQRMASRRSVFAMDEAEAKADPQFVGDPKVNGLDKPRGGGFSIMQNLAKAQAEVSLEKASENPKVSPIQASVKVAGLRAKALSKKETEEAVNNEAWFVSSPTLEKIRNHAVISLKSTIVGDLHQQIAKLVDKIESDIVDTLQTVDGIEMDKAVNFSKNVAVRIYNPASPSLRYPDSERYSDRLEQTVKEIMGHKALSRDASRKIGKAVESIVDDFNSQVKTSFKKVERLTESEVADILSKDKKTMEFLEREGMKLFASDMRCRRGMYWCGPERTYRMTKREIASGQPSCPKCCAEMGKHRFTRNAKLFICEGCGFKISSDKILTDKPIVEAIPVEPQVTVANCKSRRQSS